MTYEPRPDDWCYFHQRSEPYTTDDHVCGECFHTFKPGELLTEWNLLASRTSSLGLATSEQEVFSCPFCAHDL